MSNALVSERNLQALINKQLISELVYSYSRAIDRQDFPLLQTLYTQDGFDDHGGLYRGDIPGYIEWLELSMRACDITAHSVHNHLIAFTDENMAEGEVYVTAYHRLHDEEGGFTEFTGGFRYIDQYRQDHGNWRFARRQLVIDWYRIAPTSWDLDHPWLQGTPTGKMSVEDPSYGLTHTLFARL